MENAPPPLQSSSPDSSEPVPIPKSSIAGLVLGIFSFCTGFLTAIPGLIFSILGLMKSNRVSNQTGTVLAIIGIATSAVGACVGTAVLASMAMPAYNKITERAKVVKEVNEVKQLLLACRAYASDNDGKYPPSLQALVPDYLELDALPVWNPPDAIPADAEVAQSPYGYVTGLTATSPVRTVMIYSGVYHAEYAPKRVIGFVGGQVMEVPEHELGDQLPRLVE